ncbi:hypothetical protein ACERII_07270 [Evansella sp. AB-rgal1]|uniref:hypothetical protein n=1 Tax=Evansella sp. AB-rgal1 TaxID=3242696 RepID=UPI00359E4F9D
MYQNRVTMIIFLIFWIFVLRLFFFEEERSIIHFLLGVTILGVMLFRYRSLSIAKKKSQANITLLICAILLVTIFMWYIQPLIF